MRDRVDRNTLRVNQLGIMLFVAAGFVLGTEVGRWLVLFTALVLALGTLHPAFELFKQVHRRVLKPAGILGPDVHAEDPRPHRFAQGLGGVFLLAASVALFAGAEVVGWVLAWVVFALALVNLAVRFCAGCFIYFQLERAGLLRRSAEGAPGAR